MSSKDDANDITRTHVHLTKDTIIGHYRIVEKIGAGGMGEVYLAEDTELNRRVALKFLPPHLCQDADCRARFKREAQAAAKLNHPNIVTIHEVSEFNGRPYIAMELLEGQSLRDLIKQKDIPLSQAIQISIQLCEGLQEAHAAGIIHRDIKPSNAIIDQKGRCKLVDFGLASIHGGEHLTKTGSTLGTVGYMSPEQARGEEVDSRSDLFSLGVVLYELIAGRTPFTAESEIATIKNVIEAVPEPLARYKNDVPDELQRIISKALTKDKNLRYQHADDLATDLRSVWRSSESIGASRSQNTSTVTKRKWAYLIAGLAMLAVTFLLIKVYVFKPAEEPLDSLAVLPLQNLSGDSDQEYFSDGMTEALITELQKIKSLRVISRTSVMRFKKTEESLPEIAKKLTVKAVVEGSVLREGDSVRINVQLIQASPEKHLWASNYQRSMRNILALQSDVARAIAKEVQAIVTPEEQKELASSRPVDPEAHEAYLKGRFYWNKRTGHDLIRAIEYFDLAIEKEPTYAQAYAGLASTYAILPQLAGLPSKETVAKAETAARRALQLDSTLAEAHTVLGCIKSDYEWDWPGAESEFKRAIELDPNYPTAHHWYSGLLCYLGRLDEALTEIKRAQELDPLSLIINSAVGDALYNMRKYDEATDQLVRVLELDPHFMVALYTLGSVYEAEGKLDEAISKYQEVRRLVGSGTLGLSDLGRAYARTLRKEDANDILNELFGFSKQGDLVSFDIANVYYGLGDNDKTFEWLEKAYHERSFMLLDLKTKPLWDSLRSDPRFKELLRKMKLE